MRRTATALVVAAALLATAGCGLGAGKKLSGGARLDVTRDFGHTQLYATHVPTVRKDETVMRLLESKRNVKTSYGGKFVDAIGGLGSGGAGGHRDWFYFVNGIEAQVGAAEHTVSPGDVVQWDYRNWNAAMHIPAIVGAYPEPFARGTGGKRLPVRLECADPQSAACKTVDSRLRTQGVRPGPGELGGSVGPKTLRVVVGPWSALRKLGGVVGQLRRGPSASGVFASFSADGTRLTLLNQLGHPARLAPPGTGLVAATAGEGSEPVWIITGTGGAGVDAAARALDQAALKNAFAVAVTPQGVVRLPVLGG